MKINIHRPKGLGAKTPQAPKGRALADVVGMSEFMKKRFL